MACYTVQNKINIKMVSDNMIYVNERKDSEKLINHAIFKDSPHMLPDAIWAMYLGNAVSKIIR